MPISNAIVAAHQRIVQRAQQGPVDATLLTDATTVDWGLHDLMVDALGNELISDTYRINSLRVRLIRLESSTLSPESLVPAMEEHLWFIEALSAARSGRGRPPHHPSHRERAPARARTAPPAPARREGDVVTDPQTPAEPQPSHPRAAPNASLPGVWPALLTPLDARLDIDHRLLVSHSRALLAAGCGGVTPFGTTGEGPSFGVDERRAAIDALLEGGIPAAHILVSTSCAALPDTLALTRHALSVGAWGCLMMPPFFFKGVSDAGIVDAYRYVIDGAADSAAAHRAVSHPAGGRCRSVARGDRRTGATLSAHHRRHQGQRSATAPIRWHWPRPSCRR